ncbi:MAG: tail fiber domain-containing protein, partial [Elusimicrobia bacterium]|nr:tail fiber domain-containing protein [Elusimicrobiota bacterium]
IGTSSPTAVLSIQGNGASNYRGIIVQNTFQDAVDKGAMAVIGARKNNANAPFTGFGTWDTGSERRLYVGGGGWMMPDATVLSFWTAPTYTETTSTAVERMRIVSGGNVGIGTSAPAAKLDVVGDAQFGSGAARSTFTATGALALAADANITLAGTGKVTGLAGPSAPSDAATKQYVDDTTGAAGGGWTDEGSVVRLTASNDNVVVQSTLTVQGSGFSVGGSTLVVSAGSVGIGTTSPGAKLEVSGNLRLTKEAGRVISVGDSTTADTSGASFTIQGAAGTGTAAGGDVLLYGGAAGTSNGNRSGNIILGGLTRTNGVQAGNVIISGDNAGSNASNSGGSISLTGGTAGPQAPNGVTGGPIAITGGAGGASGSYHHGGGVTLTGGAGNATAAANGGGIAIVTGAGGSTSGNSGDLTLKTGNYTSGSFGTIAVQQGSNTRMFIDALGSVGIGTTSPSVKLHVGSSDAEIVRFASTNPAGGIVSDNALTGDYVAVTLNDTRTANEGAFLKFNIPNSTTLTTTEDMAAFGAVASDGTDGSRKADLVFVTRNSSQAERMRVKFDGNVGIGTSSNIDQALTIKGNLGITNDNVLCSGLGCGNPTAGSKTQIELYDASTGDLIVQTGTAGTRNIRFGTGSETMGNNERMRIEGATGNVAIGATAAVSAALHVEADTTSSPQAVLDLNNIRTGSSSENMIRFKRLGTQVGSITSSDSATAYNTTSDRRLKTDIRDLEGALELVGRLKPRRYRWRKSGDPAIGFVAQELREVFPQAVSAPEDEMWGVDYGQLTPLLAGAIQDLRAENARLEARLAAMEARLAEGGPAAAAVRGGR